MAQRKGIKVRAKAKVKPNRKGRNSLIENVATVKAKSKKK